MIVEPNAKQQLAMETNAFTVKTIATARNITFATRELAFAMRQPPAKWSAYALTSQSLLAAYMITLCMKKFAALKSVKIAQSVQPTCVIMANAFTVLKNMAPITASKELLATMKLAFAVKLKRDPPAPQ